MKTLKELIDDAQKYEALAKDYALLQEALAWALQEGAQYNHDGWLENGGCGCCSTLITPPEHLAKLFRSGEK